MYILVQAISNPGDVAIVPDPTYPIHSQAFILAGANVEKMQLIFDEETFEVDEDRFLADVEESFGQLSATGKIFSSQLST